METEAPGRTSLMTSMVEREASSLRSPHPSPLPPSEPTVDSFPGIQLGPWGVDSSVWKSIPGPSVQQRAFSLAWEVLGVSKFSLEVAGIMHAPLSYPHSAGAYIQPGGPPGPSSGFLPAGGLVLAAPLEVIPCLPQVGSGSLEGL